MSIQSYPRVVVQATGINQNQPSGFCMMYFDNTINAYVQATPTNMGVPELISIANNTGISPNGWKITELLEEPTTGLSQAQLTSKISIFAQWNTFRTKVFNVPIAANINLYDNGSYPVKLVFNDDNMAISALTDVLGNSVLSQYAETTNPLADPIVNRNGTIISIGNNSDDYFGNITLNKGHFTAYYLNQPVI